MSGKQSLRGVPIALLPYQKRHCPMHTHRSFLNLYSMRQLCQNGQPQVSASTGSGWRAVNSHHSSLDAALLAFVANCDGDTPAFCPLLISVYTVLRPSLFLTLVLSSYPKNVSGVSKKMKAIQWDS